MPSTSRHRRTRRAIALALAVPCTAALLTGPTATAHADTPPPPRAVLAGSHPAYAVPAAEGAAVAPDQRLTARVYLASRNPAGLAAFAQAVSDPASPRHGAFLSYPAFEAAFGPSPAETAQVSAWLVGAGLSITATTAHYVEASGSATAMQTAFQAELRHYTTRSGPAIAPTADLSVPAALGAAVLSVSGVATEQAAIRPAAVRAPAVTAATSPPTCSAYYGAATATGLPPAYARTTPYAPCPYRPSQLRAAYGVSASRLTGAGTTIAIVDAYGSPTMAADADRFATDVGDQPLRPGQYSEQVTPADFTDLTECGGPAAWAPEEALDVETAHGMAPDANVLYVGGNSCLDPDLIDAEWSVIDGHRADVISDSWDEVLHARDSTTTPGLVNVWQLVFQQAAAMGIGVYVASGDCGDNSPTAAATAANCDPTTEEAQTDFPAASPWVTAVGGTAMATTATGDYAWETDLGDLRSVLSPDGGSWEPFPGPFTLGGGGGASEEFVQPWYQRGIVPTLLARTLLTGARTALPRRVLPDVAMNGDLATATLVGFSDPTGTYGEAAFGGTSVATPAFAALQLDAQQGAHRPIGFANPDLYRRDLPGLLHDVVAHPAAAGPTPILADIHDAGTRPDGSRAVTLIAIGQDEGLAAGPGYDDATGLGSPTLAYLLSYAWYG